MVTKAPFVADVVACGGCPLFHSDDRNGEYCAHPMGAQVKVSSADDEPPKRCPLRAQSLLVQVRR